jgi:WD40 repeat protein
VAASGWSDRIWVWELGHHVVQLRENAGPVFSIAFSPDGSRLASTTMAQNEVVVGAPSGRLVSQLRGHVAGVASVAFS